jgi:hypothetical protein
MLNDKFTQLEVSAFADSTIDQFPQLPSLFQHHVLFQNILALFVFLVLVISFLLHSTGRKLDDTSKDQRKTTQHLQEQQQQHPQEKGKKNLNKHILLSLHYVPCSVTN